MRDDGILRQGINQVGYYSRNYYPVYALSSYLTAPGNLGMIFSLVLGAKLAKPEKTVVVVSGELDSYTVSRNRLRLCSMASW